MPHSLSLKKKNLLDLFIKSEFCRSSCDIESLDKELAPCFTRKAKRPMLTSRRHLNKRGAHDLGRLAAVQCCVHLPGSSLASAFQMYSINGMVWEGGSLSVLGPQCLILFRVGNVKTKSFSGQIRVTLSIHLSTGMLSRAPASIFQGKGEKEHPVPQIPHTHGKHVPRFLQAQNKVL